MKKSKVTDRMKRLASRGYSKMIDTINKDLPDDLESELFIRIIEKSVRKIVNDVWKAETIEDLLIFLNINKEDDEIKNLLELLKEIR